MKKCPACNRTYADETLSFCLEDGSLLSASFSPYEEQETVVRPNSAEILPTQYYSPPSAARSEFPTNASAQNAIPVYAQPPKPKNKNDLKILFWLWAGFIVAAIYTMSIFPALFGSVIALIYLFVRILIKSAAK